MKTENRDLIISVGVVLVIVVGAYAGLVLYTGFTSPFSVVMSQSMQDDPYQSELGSIDTGDVVITLSPEKANIQGFIEGTQTGFSTFGDYGSVIIYERGNNQNPVIHRAILWLDYVGEEMQTVTSNGETIERMVTIWSAPSLAGYQGEWYYIDHNGNRVTGNSTNWDHITGTLGFIDITKAKKDVSVNLDRVGTESGFITMGDNIGNNYFDQTSIVDSLVSMNDIRSVPVFEIPWIGALKILLKNDGQNLQYVPNSLPSLVMVLGVIFGLLIIIDAIAIHRNILKIGHERSKLRNRI